MTTCNGNQGMTSRSCYRFGLLLLTFFFISPSDAFTTPFARVRTNNAVTAMNLMPADPSSILESVSTMLADATDAVPPVGEVTYSKASYYTILGLYVLSFPGIWSQIKRSTAAKIKRKSYVSPGENAKGGKGLRQQAGEIMAYMTANNYEVVEAGETIIFRGIVQRSVSQAFFLTFCTALGLLSLALVLQIQFQNLELPVIGEPNWYLLSLLSPYAGIYYWRSGDRVDDCEVKLVANDDETQNEIIIQGNEEELERMWRTLELQEKGMVKIPGLLEEK